MSDTGKIWTVDRSKEGGICDGSVQHSRGLYRHHRRKPTGNDRRTVRGQQENV